MSIRKKLLLLLGLCVVGFGCLFIVNTLGSRKTEAMSQLRDMAMNAQLHVLQARRQEKNFLMHGEERYVKQALAEIAAIDMALRGLGDRSPGDGKVIRNLEKNLTSYREAFRTLTAAQRAMGTLESGAEHDFVMAARKLEKFFRGETDTDLLIALLQMRRQEKNYQLRGSQEYVDKVHASAALIRGFLRDRADLRPALDEYEQTFVIWAESRKSRSLYASQLVEYGRALEPGISALQEDFGNRREAVRRQVATFCVITEVGAVLVVVFLVLWVIRTITGRLGSLAAYSTAVASGNLSATPVGEFTGELAGLRNDITAMVSGLREKMALAEEKERQALSEAERARIATEEARRSESEVCGLLERIGVVSDQAQGIARGLASSSTDLSKLTGEVYQGTEVQKDRVAETATAMGQMNATVLGIARSAGAASEAAGTTRETAQRGLAVVADAESAMERVNDITSLLRRSMDQLGADAESVGQVIDVINEIADQTNLLALNAAIEAARAGDAGRGFAVVADEVRKLAEKTMAATQEVASRVHTIQNSAKSNLAEMDKAASAVAEANALTSDSAHMLGEITDLADNTASQVLSIAVASEEQSAASEQINRALGEVNTVAVDTAEGMGRADQAVGVLVRTADELNELIHGLRT